jgi:dipeptidyl aminopeptidase/acylaminoacyl peptidase
MRPDQLGDYRVPSDAFLHPDGERAVFVVSQMDLEEDEYIRQLWLWDGEISRQLTSGRADSSPRWSPDGATLAFLRKGPGDDDRPQLALLPIGGGEAEIATAFDLGVNGLEWSPDGSRIALVVPEYVDGIDDEDERKRAPRRITAPAFRFDNLGWTYDKRAHLWSYDVATGDTAQITDGDFNDSSPRWSPDGTTITFLSARHDDRWTDPFNQVFTVPATGGDPDTAAGLGFWSWSGYNPTGQLHAIGLETDTINLDPNPFVLIDDKGSVTELTDLDRNLMPGHPAGPLTAPRFVDDGSATMILEDRRRARDNRLVSFLGWVDGCIHRNGSDEPR